MILIQQYYILQSYLCYKCFEAADSFDSYEFCVMIKIKSFKEKFVTPGK